jgi:hypothetical protein
MSFQSLSTDQTEWSRSGMADEWYEFNQEGWADRAATTKQSKTPINMEKATHSLERAHITTAGLPDPVTAVPVLAPASRSRDKKRRALQSVATGIALVLFGTKTLPTLGGWMDNSTDAGVLSEAGLKCAQSLVLTPSGNLTDVYQPDVKDRIVNWLSGAVQIPTECFDVMGPIGEDKRWDAFASLHDYFEKSYPLV